VAELADILGFAIAGFVDDDPQLDGKQVLKWRVLGGRECVPSGASVALGIGSNEARQAVMAEADARGWNLPVLVHPSAVLSPSAEIGAGTVVMAQTVVTSRTKIGRGCILNTACSVDHDCVVGDLAHIAPGTRVGGGVAVGSGALVGIGSSVRPYLEIGQNAVIGAGAVVVRDIPDSAVAYGNPARVNARK
jgi:sugar O-acyltransferase (sialic acid O-acetyltransferase NeuD family)